jgi:hypothetical protein
MDIRRPSQKPQRVPVDEADPFAVVHAAAARVTEARRSNAALRASADNLLADCLCAEAVARLAGDNAVVMPEDLGDWVDAGPRVAGLVTRIRQVHEQYAALTSAISANSSVAPKARE